jgi:hypothetical protein
MEIIQQIFCWLLAEAVVAIAWVAEEVVVVSFTNPTQLLLQGRPIPLLLEMGVSMAFQHKAVPVMERIPLHLGLLYLEVVVADINTVTLTRETTAVAEEVDQPMRVAQAQVDLWLQVSLAYLCWLGLLY